MNCVFMWFIAADGSIGRIHILIHAHML